MSQILQSFFGLLPAWSYSYWHSVLEYISTITDSQWRSICGSAFGVGLILLIVLATMMTPTNGHMPEKPPSKDRHGD